MSKFDSTGARFDLERRRAANDAFRTDLVAGAVMFSAGLLALGVAAQQDALAAVRQVTEFDDDTDDEHAVGDVEVQLPTDNAPSAKLLIFFRIYTMMLGGQPTQLLWLTLADEWWGAETEVGDTCHAPDDPPITEVEDCTDPTLDVSAPPSFPNDEFRNALRNGATVFMQDAEPDVAGAVGNRASEADSDDASVKIRQLNDALRCTFQGGTVLITAGIAALDIATQARVIAAVQAFDQFNDDNDPWGEHDMGALQVDGHRIFFKLDYYDLTRSMLAEDPSNPATTERVLTIMLAEEY